MANMTYAEIKAYCL